MMMITLPVFEPLLGQFNFDRLWFGIMFTVSIELALITPPFGFNLFYMRSVVPPSVTMTDVYKSIYPYVILEIIVMVLLIIWPQIVLWLPAQIMGQR
jgi:TRAP-type mannitol/chloroaromatic compound transport system permease large subunit